MLTVNPPSTSSSSSPPVKPLLQALAKDPQAAAELNRPRKKTGFADFATIAAQLKRETTEASMEIAEKRLDFDRMAHMETQEDKKERPRLRR